MATWTISQGKISSAQWEELRYAVLRTARCFHYENKAEYAIFKLIRQQFGCRASELPVIHFDAALATVAEAAKRADQFRDLRYQLETEALKMIFGPTGLEGLPDRIEATLDALGSPLATKQVAATHGNVLQFPKGAQQCS